MHRVVLLCPGRVHILHLAHQVLLIVVIHCALQLTAIAFVPVIVWDLEMKENPQNSKFTGAMLVSSTGSVSECAEQSLLTRKKI